MRTSLDCIPCFARQALQVARFATDDQAVQERFLREVLHAVAQMDLAQPPPVVGQHIHRRLRELTGLDDPYRAAKDRFNKMAVDMLPELTARMQESADPLAAAVRLSIAGNVIDMGVNGDLTEDQVRSSVYAAWDQPLEGDLAEFRRAVDAAKSIMYLTDNAGEIVFDRLLIQLLPMDRVTAVVRGRPVLNDATMADARAAGLCELVEVMDNGSDAPGTILADCSPQFRRRFSSADLIIAKGQGNFETLSDEPGNIYFLFKVKCPVIADHVGLPVGTHAAISAGSSIPLTGGKRDARI